MSFNGKITCLDELNNYGHSVEQMLLLQYRCFRTISSTQNTNCRKIICKTKRSEWGWEEDINYDRIQTGREWDSESIGGDGAGTGIGSKYCTMSSSSN